MIAMSMPRRNLKEDSASHGDCSIQVICSRRWRRLEPDISIYSHKCEPWRSTARAHCQALMSRASTRGYAFLIRTTNNVVDFILSGTTWQAYDTNDSVVSTPHVRTLLHCSLTKYKRIREACKASSKVPHKGCGWSQTWPPLSWYCVKPFDCEFLMKLLGVFVILGFICKSWKPPWKQGRSRIG